jgi:arsenite-transporting ATPase
MGWGGNNQNANRPSTGEEVIVMLAGTADRINVWFSEFNTDARFRVTHFPTTLEDARSKLATNPEVIVLDGSIAKSASELVQFLTDVQCAVYVVVPAVATDEEIAPIKQLTSVKSVFVGDVNIAQLRDRMYGDALALRKQAPGLSWSGQRSSSIAGTRIITVWNLIGGAGRSTIATALAHEAGQRGFQSLLIGLDAPDTNPLQNDLRSTPNIENWIANPTAEGMRAAIQEAGSYDMLAGFTDALAQDRATHIGKDAPEHLSNLFQMAMSAGYAVIVIDAPTHSVSPVAIAASNTWLMMARPTLADAWASVQAYAFVTQRMAGQHRIVPGNIFTVLNQFNSGMLSDSEFHEAASTTLSRMNIQTAFPPITETIPYSKDVPIAQNSGRPVLNASAEIARPVGKIANRLFGEATAKQVVRRDKVKKIGGITFRKKGD